jgi:hypothetical protein
MGNIYINEKQLKRIAHEHDKQLTDDFKSALNRIVHHITETACTQFNGKAKRVDSSLIPKKYQLK